MTDVYQKYKELKRLLPIYNDIDFSKVLAFDLAYSVYSQKKIKFTSVKWLFKRIYIRPAKTDCIFTIGEYGWRGDYQQILKFVSEKIEDRQVVELNKYKFSFSFLRSFIESLVLLKDIILSKECSIKAKIYLISKASFYLNSKEYILAFIENSECSRYVAFSSVHTIEALFTECTKSYGIVSMSLQHGVAHIHKGNVPIDMLSYENFNCDKQLCWGEYSKKEYEKYGIPENKLVVCGYPRDFIYKNRNIIKNNKAVVFLSRHAYHDVNLKVLKMIKKIQGFKFELKLHPSLNKSDYDAFCGDNLSIIENQTVSDILLRDWEYSLSVNTSAYYESLLSGIPSFVYEGSGYDGFAIVEGTGFTDLESLKKLITKGINRDMKKKLDYFLGSEKDHYRKEIINA
ncbi:TPA: hypothetical protein RQK73_004476 [Vibrio vulnificus]|nr:hypothetical protein [Vibrio vulnificus]